MRKLHSVAVAMTAALVLAGCSGSEEEPTDAGESPETSQSQDADTSTRDQAWTIAAGEPMTKRETHYKAVCIQWDGYQDGVPWHPSMLDNARASKNALATEAVNRLAEDLATAEEEASEETTALFEELCADVDR